jgi:hypothetical protein
MRPELIHPTRALSVLWDVLLVLGARAEAVALFCYQVWKWSSALGSIIGGLDTIARFGSSGEIAAEVLARICEGLAFLIA